VFAGAAREAVFSRSEVIRRVQADFIPVALKAALVNNPPDDAEGQLYREIVRSKIAPQGICVANSAGKVLAWALMFDDDKSVMAFLDHAAKRFADYPDAKRPVAAERYMKYPSARLPDIADSDKALPADRRHAKGKRCPAQPGLRAGTVAARVFGRALDKDGKPLADTLRQEHYVEDRFHVSVVLQEKLAQALVDAGSGRFRIPDELARLLVSHAYLGQIDLNPLGSPGGGKGELKRCELWGQKTEGDGGTWVRLEGRSHVVGGQDALPGHQGDGRVWHHEVELSWQGLIQVQGKRMSRLLLAAHGSEKLMWGNHLAGMQGEVAVAHLPGGHLIDLACGVRYGIIGEPIPADQAVAAAEAAPDEGEPIGPVPVQVRRQLLEALGTPYLVFLDQAQAELKLSDEQKQKLDERLLREVRDAGQLFQRLPEMKPEEREKELHAYRRKAHEALGSWMGKTFKPEQFQRLRQLMLQREGPFGLLNPDVATELKLTEEQRKQLMTVVGELEQKLRPLLEEAHAKGNHEEIRPKALKVRAEHGRRLEAVLTDGQKKQWQEMLGKPLDLGE
jgi:hypothetical protein